MAVEELEAAVGRLVGEQAAGDAHRRVEGQQGVFLAVGVEAEVPLVGDEVAGA